MSVPPRNDIEPWTAFVFLLLFTVLCFAVGVMLALGDPRPH